MLKNNTLTVALAALLVGGVATAGYMNSRGTSPGATQPQPVVTTAPPALTATPAAVASSSLAPAPAPASGLEYAEVVNVQPITRREPLYATVLGSTPIRDSSTTTSPHQVCEDVVVQERAPERDGNVGGTVAGAVIGGLVGNQVGKGNGRKAATVAGAVAGGFIGREVDRRHVGGRVVNRTERQCHTVNSTSTQSRTVAWDVTYRNPDGSTGTMQTEKKPGQRIALGDASKTIGYDVTYRLRGAEHTLRMDQKPGAQLPVINGQVVTQVAEVGGSVSR